MDDKKNHANEKSVGSVGAVVEITPTFSSVLSFALATKRGALLKPWQQQLDALTDQNLVDLIEALANVLDVLGDKEIECHHQRETIEVIKDSYEALCRAFDKFKNSEPTSYGSSLKLVQSSQERNEPTS